MHTYPLAGQLVNGFVNRIGKTVHPSLLIVNDSARRPITNLEALVAFRNAFALSVIIETRELSPTTGHLTHPHYSDYFDFYPVVLSKANDGFITSSPAVLDFSFQTEDFRGQTSPGLAGQKNPSLGLEKDLFESLMKVWARRFAWRRKGEWSTRCLFRSLEIAYHASAMPFRNHSTIYDYGSSVSLWVSAFEILSHPRNREAGLTSVLNLLGEYRWVNKLIRKRVYRLKHGRIPHKVNLVQRLYKDLYDARNDFLHGNPVRISRLYPFRNRRRPPITVFAPLIYKVALLCFLAPYRDKRRKTYGLQEYARRQANEYQLDEVLLLSRGR